MQRKMNLFATQRLVELLSNIEHQIAYTFTESIRYRNSFQVSYLDFGSTNDSVSFIARNKYDDIQKSNPGDWNSLVWKDKRAEMKIGKLIRLFYGDHFPTNHPKDKPRPKPQMDIESFVNKFKAERDKDVNYDRFEIVGGKDFHYWYSQSNYSRFVHEETTLGRSCLRYEESSKFLKMYSMNPDTFRMLILKDDSGRLRGRANLWTLEQPKGRIYMDRIYSVNDFDVELFKDYAKQNGWIHKESQTFGYHNNIVDTKTGDIHNWDKLTLLSKIKKIPGTHYKYYPYLDTLSIYNTEEHTLTNDGRLRVLEPHIILSDYQGSYNSEVDGRERVFSTAYNEYIVRDEATFVEIDDTWVYSNDAVYVHNSGGKHSFRNSDKVVESYIYKRKWFLKSDAIFSEYLGTYIHEGSVRTAFLDDEKKEEVKIHYRMVGREFEEKDGVILKKKISQNPKQSTKRSTGDKYSFEEMLQRVSNGSITSSGRTRSRSETIDQLLRGNALSRDPWSRLLENEQSPSGNTFTTDHRMEEDSDPFAGVDLSQYTEEVRNYLYERLEDDMEQRIDHRNRRNEGGDRLFDIGDLYNIPSRPGQDQGRTRQTQVQRGRPVVDEPRPTRATTNRIQFRPVSDDLLSDATENAEDGQPVDNQPRNVWTDTQITLDNVRRDVPRREEVREEPIEDTSGDLPDVIEDTVDGGNSTTHTNTDLGNITYGTYNYNYNYNPAAPNDWDQIGNWSHPQSNDELRNALRQSYMNLGIPSRFLGGDDEPDVTNNEEDSTTDED